ncbi:AraC family transcriptional regulator [Paenibacillus sp. GD4]|uniref:AraC family transcriptional regulator n=1 Tax=Paenibacillus sp. GD4 TaxID=3068890 RepID=UPI00279645B1|nr:AraC family transcriptional regulator [Paenibacillus sp. GD4]MDQ1914123.1 AraC family transcriptional regulator [Paenibacillus sp. GD4]
MNYQLIDARNSGKAHCEVGWNWRPAPLPDYDLWCVLGGSGTMKLNGLTYPIRKGACFLVHPGDTPIAEQNPDDRLTVIYIHFTLQYDSVPSCEVALLPERVVYLQETYELERLLHQVLDTRFKQDDWTMQEFDCLMKQLLIKLYRGRRHNSEDMSATLSRKQRQAVIQVMRRIQEDGWKGRPYEELAAQVGLTPSYLAKLFKRHAGMSMKKYMTQARLERARHLLSETTMNVSQVSDALGYSSIFLFSKQFKKQFGQPPSAFQHEGIQAKPH